MTSQDWRPEYERRAAAADAEHQTFAEQTTVSTAENVVAKARSEDLLDQHAAARRRVSGAQGQLTKARKDWQRRAHCRSTATAGQRLARVRPHLPCGDHGDAEHQPSRARLTRREPPADAARWDASDTVLEAPNTSTKEQ